MTLTKKEWGIGIGDLIKISKATKIVTYNPKDAEEEWRYCEWDVVFVNLSEGCVCYKDHDEYDGNLYEYLKRPLSEFGKTWGLKKEDIRI